MKTGILGGTFNPIHMGHIELCQYAKIRAGLDRIVLMPTGDNPLKRTENKIHRKHRLKMAQLCCEKFEDLSVSDMEIKREGFSYTIDTVRELKKKYDEEIYFICGSDVLFQLPYWRECDALLKLITFVAVKRRGVDNASILQEAEKLHCQKGASIILLEDFSPEEISSREIRRAIRKNESVKKYLSKSVFEYIQDNNLYKE